MRRPPARREDLGFHERWLVPDAILRRPCSHLGDHHVQHCSRKRPATYVRGTGNRRRWEIAVLPGEDEAAITQPAKVLELLKPWVEPAAPTANGGCRLSQTRSTRSIAGCCSLPRSARRRQVAFLRPLPKERPQVAQTSISRIPEG